MPKRNSMSMVGRVLSAPPRKIYVQGWVVGLTWHDGGEWLFYKKQLVRHFGAGKESNPTIYPDKDKAMKIAQDVQPLHAERPIFIREYTYETHLEQNLPLLDGTTEKIIFLPSLTSV